MTNGQEINNNKEGKCQYFRTEKTSTNIKGWNKANFSLTKWWYLTTFFLLCFSLVTRHTVKIHHELQYMWSQTNRVQLVTYFCSRKYKLLFLRPKSDFLQKVNIKYKYIFVNYIFNILSSMVKKRYRIIRNSGNNQHWAS